MTLLAALIVATLGLPLTSASLRQQLIETPVPKEEVHTRLYRFHIAPGTIAPDGVPKDALLVNGRFPGPLITANQGEIVQVITSNGLHTDGTSIHYHGLLQNGTPWQDGTPAVQVCPIVPGDSISQRFKAERPGVSWWHSHYSAQHVDGVKGPLIIRGPTAVPYDIDLGAVLLSDWYHQDYKHYIRLENGVPGAIPFPPDSNLINGKGQHNCTLGYNCPTDTPYSVFRFQYGKKHLLRIINTATDFYQCLSIDGHRLMVISVDFVPVEPYTVDCLSLHNGQRAEVIVDANQPANSSWLMRAQIQPGVPDVPINMEYLTSVAVVHYDQASPDTIPRTSVSSGVAAQCARENEANNRPIERKPVASAEVVEEIRITFEKNATGHTLYYLNNRTFRGDYGNPLLFQARAGNTSFTPERNVYDFGSNATVLAQGLGTWDGQIMNGDNPSRRDTVVIPPATGSLQSHLVVQWEADNPGVWPFHCHAPWHSSIGMFFNVLEQPQKLQQLYLDPKTEESLIERCSNWQNFTYQHTVDQIDSGL